VQSVECSNVGKDTCSSHYREDAVVCSSHAREDTTCISREPGWGWVIIVRCYLCSNIPQTVLVATLDTYDLQFEFSRQFQNIYPRIGPLSSRSMFTFLYTFFWRSTKMANSPDCSCCDFGHLRFCVYDWLERSNCPFFVHVSDKLEPHYNVSLILKHIDFFIILVLWYSRYNGV
jgi:hypothetical protein